jgi:hypothetical protein
MRLHTLFMGIGLLALHAASSAACAPIPYTVRLKEAAGKLTVTVPTPILALRPVGAGAEYARSMYAAMAPSVVREVLDGYGCLVKEGIAADYTPGVDKQALADAWENAVADLQSTAGMFFVSYADSVAAGNALNPYPQKQSLETEMKGLAKYVQALPKENFLLEDSLKAYLEATIAGAGVNACGKLVRAALAQNAPAIQHLAAAVLPALNKYFSPTSQYGPRNAKIDLWTEAQAARMVSMPAGTEATKAVQECMK